MLTSKQELLAEIKECWALEREYGCEILTLPELVEELKYLKELDDWDEIKPV